MAEQPSSVLAMRTAFWSGAHLEAAARRTGFVPRTSNMTGKLLLALMTVGRWSDATTTLAPLVAQASQLSTQVAVSPEALYQRRNTRALAFLQAMLRTAFATLQAGAHACDESRLAPFDRVHIAESTGFELPESLPERFPAAGGRAAPAGANMQRVWDDQPRGFTPVARRPWNIPDQQ